MKNVFKVFAAMRSIAIITLVVVIGFSFAALSLTGCGGHDDSPILFPINSPVTISGDFIGTWTSTDGVYTSTIIVTSTTWIQKANGYYYDDGYFASWDGTSGNIYSNALKKVVGTATIINPTTARVVLNSNAENPGTYTYTKTSP